MGAYWAGMKFDNHYFSEVEPFAVELYQKRFPDAIPLGDITKIKTEDLPHGEYIITGGFPCQDISIAGKGEGIHGKRSGLWFEYWRLIRDLQPRFAIMENVGMLVHRGLREVLGSLAEIGYNAEWQDIRAEDMGAPHKRERIWILAYPGRKQPWGPQKSKRSSSNITGCSNRGNSRSESISKKDKIPNPDSTGLEREKSTGESRQHNGLSTECSSKLSDTISKHDDNSGHGASEICGERSETSEISGRSGRHYWPVEPAVGRLAHGIPRRVDRLKGLGNAIVPQIAELLFRQIKGII